VLHLAVVSGGNQRGLHLQTSDDRETAMTSQPTEGTDGQEPQSWTQLGKEMWSYLTGRGAAINYKLIDMTVEVPRDTGENAPRATWKFDGTLQITTADNAS
jgi:hypothetical protein